MGEARPSFKVADDHHAEGGIRRERSIPGGAWGVNISLGEVRGSDGCWWDRYREFQQRVLRWFLEPSLRDAVRGKLGLAWHVRSADWRGYRNGSYVRKVVTPWGGVEVLLPRLRDGKLDLLCPMGYSPDTATFADQIADAARSICGKPICAGTGAWRIPAESAVAKIAKATEIGAAGSCLF